MAKDKNIELEDNQHEDLVPAHSASDDEANSRAAEASAPADGVGDPRDQVTRLQAERDALFDRLARQQAEFENLKKRAAREQAEFREYAVADTVKQLIPILDNFDLALRSKAAGDGGLRKGVG